MIKSNSYSEENGHSCQDRLQDEDDTFSSLVPTYFTVFVAFHGPSINAAAIVASTAIGTVLPSNLTCPRELELREYTKSSDITNAHSCSILCVSDERSTKLARRKEERTSEKQERKTQSISLSLATHDFNLSPYGCLAGLAVRARERCAHVFSHSDIYGARA